MTEPCARHRPYLAALADGELRLVPEATRDHVTECPACAAEVAGHGLLGEKLRAGFDEAVIRERRRPARVRALRRGAALLGIAATLAVSGVGATAVWRATHGGPDVVGAAVTAAHQQPLLWSSDPAAIGAWCARISERNQPQVPLPPLTPLGARMDSVGGTSIVTVFYAASGGHHIAVGWLDATLSTPASSRIETHTVAGQTALVMQTPRGTAVLSGDVTIGALWDSAATLETLTR